MRLGIVAVGRLKSGGERVLVDRYLERLKGGRGIGLGPAYEKEIGESQGHRGWVAQIRRGQPAAEGRWRC